MKRIIFILMLLSTNAYAQQTITLGEGKYGVTIEIRGYSTEYILKELKRLDEKLQACNLCREEVGGGSWAASGGVGGYSSVKVTRPSTPPLSDSELEKLRELLKGK